MNVILFCLLCSSFLLDVLRFLLLLFSFSLENSLSRYFKGSSANINSSIFLHPRMPWLPHSFLKDIFIGIELLSVLFFQHMKNVVPLSSVLIVSNEKSSVIQSAVPLCVRCHLSHCFQDIFFSLVCRSLLWCVLVWDSLGLYCLKFTQLPNVGLYNLPNLGIFFSHYLFKCLFSPALFCFSLWNLNSTNVRCFVMVPQEPKTL